MARPNQRSKLREDLLHLLVEGAHDGKALTERLRIPRRTLDRLLADLRVQGHRVVVVRDGARWSYRLETPLQKGEVGP